MAMCIDHPSFPQQVQQLKPDLEMGGALLPAGPVRRAVVLGGSNFHIRATTKNKPAALALMRAYLVAVLEHPAGHRGGFGSLHRGGAGLA